MLVVFFRVQDSDFGILGSSGKFWAEMKFLYFLGSTHFPYQVKTKSYQKVFGKLEKYCSSNCDQVLQVN